MTTKDQSGRPDEDSTEAHARKKIAAPSADAAESETEAHARKKIAAPSADVSEDEGTEGHTMGKRRL